MIDVDCAVHGRDLGATTTAVQRAIDAIGELPPGTKVIIRGQSAAMRESFMTMGAGLVLAIVLVYLLMVANFQQLPPATGDRSPRPVSAQERSHRPAGCGYQQAMMLQARAAYEQQLALKRYEIVTAPFDGTVTTRFVDPGTLIPQSTAPSSGNPIVAMATLAPLRIYANVPQAVAPYVNDGDSATITVNEFPGREFNGTVTHHPEALDPNTRTMLVEVDLPNRDQSLLPGMYADVRITTHVAPGRILVPDDTLVFRNDKTYLPLVRADHLHLTEVKLGRDDGYRVEVTGDVQPGDMVAMNVSQVAHDGEAVRPMHGQGA